MNEAVDRVIEQREALDRGFPAGVVMSSAAHVLVIGMAIGSAWFASKPRLQVSPLGIAVPLPPGGGGPLAPEPAPAAGPPVSAPAAIPAAPPAPEPPRVIKPPKEEPKKGPPMPDAKRAKVKATPPPPPSRSASSVDPRARPGAGAPGAAGTSSATPGLGIVGPVGPGVPYGTDPLGDWYLAGVQRKIWMIWTRQLRTSSFTQQITVSFTILADGSLEDGSVRVSQPSGVQLLDLAAQRAVYSAAPFGTLPKTYATNRITIQALFQPTP